MKNKKEGMFTKFAKSLITPGEVYGDNKKHETTTREENIEMYMSGKSGILKQIEKDPNILTYDYLDKKNPFNNQTPRQSSISKIYEDILFDHDAMFNAQVHKYSRVLKQLVRYENLPEYIEENKLEEDLINHGSVAFFQHKDNNGTHLIASPYQTLQSNVAGVPTKIKVMLPKDIDKAFDIDQTASLIEKEIEKEKFVIMKGNMSGRPFNREIARAAKEYSLKKIQHLVNSLLALNTSVLIEGAKDMNMSASVLIDKMVQGDVFFYIESIEDENGVMRPELKLHDFKVPYVGKEILEELMEIDKSMYQLFGIPTAYTSQKRERQTESEIKEADPLVERFRHDFIQPRVEAVKKINEMFSHLLDKEIAVKFLIPDEPGNEVEGDDADVNKHTEVNQDE